MTTQYDSDRVAEQSNQYIDLVGAINEKIGHRDKTTASLGYANFKTSGNKQSLYVRNHESVYIAGANITNLRPVAEPGASSPMRYGFGIYLEDNGDTWLADLGGNLGLEPDGNTNADWILDNGNASGTAFRTESTLYGRDWNLVGAADAAFDCKKMKVKISGATFRGGENLIKHWRGTQGYWSDCVFDLRGTGGRFFWRIFGSNANQGASARMRLYNCVFITPDGTRHETSKGQMPDAKWFSFTSAHSSAGMHQFIILSEAERPLYLDEPFYQRAGPVIVPVPDPEPDDLSAQIAALEAQVSALSATLSTLYDDMAATTITQNATIDGLRARESELMAKITAARNALA